MTSDLVFGVELPLTPSFRLDGRRALVTGAGRGLGLAVASALAQAGAEVILAARSSRDITAAANALRAAGSRARPLTMDVADVPAARAVLKAEGAFDILVNNAGANRPKPMSETTEEDFDAIFAVNVRAAFFMAQEFAERLRSEGRPGVIVNMSSQMGRVGAANRTAYCAAKHALEGLTKAMAVEYAPIGIRINAIAPTFIETPMTKPFLEDQAFRNAVLSKIKLGRLGRVEDVMGAVVYLCSDAGALVTGSSLLVDGGWTAD